MPALLLTPLLIFAPLAAGLPTLGAPTLLDQKEIPVADFVISIKWSPSGSLLLVRSGAGIGTLETSTGEYQPILVESVWDGDWGSDDNELLFTRRAGLRSELVQLGLDNGIETVIYTGERDEVLGFRRVDSSLWTLSGPQSGVENRMILDTPQGKRVGSLEILQESHPLGDPSRRLTIWETRLRGKKSLWYSRAGGNAMRIPWSHRIIAGVYPNEANGWLAFKTALGPQGATVVVDLTGEILYQGSMLFSPSEWRPGGTELLGLVTKDSMHNIVESAIAIIDPTKDSVVRLTSGKEFDLTPAWSPDGNRIAFYRRSTDSIVIGRIEGLR